MKAKKRRVLIPVAFLLIGLFYTLEPFLSGWLEIVDPWVTQNFIFPVNLIIFGLSPNYWEWFPDIVFGSLLFIYLIYSLLAYRHNWTKTQKRFILAPFAIVIFTWLITAPLGVTFWNKRVNSFPVGAWSRMMLAGGPDIIQKDGLSLLAISSSANLAKDKIPPSILKLGSWTEIEDEDHLLLVGIPPMNHMAGQFGYIICLENGQTPIPHRLARSGNYRIRKLSNGIYFFEN